MELKFADLLSDLIQGVLLHVGMLPQDTLVDWLLKWLDDEQEDATEAIREMALRVLDIGEGDEVKIFSAADGNTAADMAQILGTIPYEVLTSVAQRVKRVYIDE